MPQLMSVTRVPPGVAGLVAGALVLVTILASGCASTRPPSPPPAAVPPAAALPDSLKWVERSAEYQAAVLQAYRMATAAVERHASSAGGRGWAVILDADETVISNLQYQIERSRVNAGFTPETWNAWVRRRAAKPLPGAAPFLARVRALGGRVAIVTNRLQSECADTQAVFQAGGLVYDLMLCRPEGGPSDKNPRFAAVAAGEGGTGPLDVAAFVGDNIQDFPAMTQAARQQGEAAFADFGVRYFLVPNPMYGGWQ
jgi:5'-nucleotidase (lipoprotein e(P4) family)